MPKAAGSKNTRKGKGKTVKTEVQAAGPPAKKARTTVSTSASSKGKRGSKRGKAKEQEERGRLWNIFERLSLDVIYMPPAADGSTRVSEDESVVKGSSYVQGQLCMDIRSTSLSAPRALAELEDEDSRRLPSGKKRG
ncbi:hypothetical protein FS837_001218 [Tulasnella sp. UAMH 9824]|nr:hypothetical protein FS837_001218 [Tulasnella sp. UAMH 9824]